MTAVPGGHGEEAGDGPEAGGDASPLPGRGHGGVRCHRLLHPGHDCAAPLPEKVPNPPACAILQPRPTPTRVWCGRNPRLLPALPRDPHTRQRGLDDPHSWSQGFMCREGWPDWALLVWNSGTCRQQTQEALSIETPWGQGNCSSVSVIPGGIRESASCSQSAV